ncbi:MAG TPA: lysylphosphatidylglycerol synthase transmembrane domain-containing protein [Anaerolineae bacterium]|nr:lysylphosphatidylglycerol synthase transmembrane domain-containing protein [Anaerolineae bacterium]
MVNQGNKKQWWQFWVGMGISGLCLIILFTVVSPQEIGVTLKGARYQDVLFCVLGIIGFLMARAVRWRFMLGNAISWQEVFHIQNIGYLLTNILPFRLGEVARALLVGQRPPVTVAQGLSTVVVERLLDLLFVVTILPFSLLGVGTLPAEQMASVRLMAVLAVMGIVGVWVAANQRPFFRRIGRWLLDFVPFLETERWVAWGDELLAGLDAFTRWRDSLILFGLSIAIWGPIIFGYYAALRAVHIEPTIAMTIFVVCSAALSIAAPSSPGQVGVFHAGVTFALVRILNQPEDLAVSFAFLYHALNFLTMVGAGLIGLYVMPDTFGSVVASTQAYLRQRRAGRVAEE